MNNVGALALLMPVALSTARRHGYAPGFLLMPLSFATLLGGMTTLIGTPPNLLISAFRAEATGQRFLLFDFAPTGLALSVGRHRLPAADRLAAAARRRSAGGPAGHLRGQGLRHRGAHPAVVAADRRRRRRLSGAARGSRAGRGARRPPPVRPAGSRRCCRPTTFCCCRPIRPRSRAPSRRTGWSSPNAAPASPSRAARSSSLMEAVVLPDAVVQGSSPLSLDLRATLRRQPDRRGAAGAALRRPPARCHARAPATSCCWRASPPG